MTNFSPRTFSSDWEHLVIDRLERSVDMGKQMGLAETLGAETGLPIGTDKASIEFPLGVNHSYAEIWERIRTVTDRATAMLHEYGLRLFAAGSHPLERIYCSSHVHVGTLLDESLGIYLENELLSYAPAFAALAANSPVAYGMYLQYKSYRVRRQALGNIRPSMWRDPATAQRIWGDDVAPKLNLAPTFEVRIIDGASSRRLLAELATVVAAFVQTQAARIEPQPPNAERYLEYLVNRWTAARHGLQATFHWYGKTRTAADLLDEMLDMSAEGLAALGVSRRDLVLINAMVEKRVCQADAVIPLAERYQDPYELASVHGKLLRDWEWFDHFLEGAAPLEPRPALTPQEIDRVHLNNIGEGTHFYRTREAMSFPAPAADAVLRRLIDAGLVVEEFTEERGRTLSRVPTQGG